MTSRVLVPSCVALCVALLPSTSLAGGYELLEQSAQGVGQAFSGVATGYGDGSEVYFNPAAMTRIKKHTASIHGHIIAPQAEFSNEGSRYVPALGEIPVRGSDGADGGETAAVGNVYVVHHPTDQLSLGLGVNTPFGLSTKYSDDWVGRYQAIESELLTININPAVAYEVNEMISLGAGLRVIYADAKLTNAVDFGTIGVSALGLPTASSLGLLPQSADGFAKVEGDDWGVGFNTGVVVTPMDNLRLGAVYRSKVTLDLEGDAKFTVPANAQILTATGSFIDTDVQAGVTFPEAVTLGGAVDLNEQFTWYLDATWTRWSRFNELRVEFDSAQPDSVQEENWNDTWRFATGLQYRPNSDWTFRTGFAFDETPVPSVNLRTPRIPDTDRYWLSAGATYDFSETLGVTLSYTHIFAPDSGTDITSSTGSRLIGEYEASVDIVSASLVGRW